jgi:hypothetical protein
MNDLEVLRTWGANLDVRVPEFSWGRGKYKFRMKNVILRDGLMRALLRIWNKDKKRVAFILNRTQQEYADKCGRLNIVLKARQVGITTYVAARFFLQTITQRGVLTMQVAHNQESAEEIFKIVHRFWENLPKALREGVLRRSHANIRQMCFPELDSQYRVGTAADPNAGRGMTIHNLHCSEVARWPRDGEDTLASLRSAVVPGGNVVLESTPNGASGLFYEEWKRAEETGYVRHFFPWWYDAAYAAPGMTIDDLTDEEDALIEKHGLAQAQIAWRRANRSSLRQLAAQEFAEDAESCFLASGESVFDLEAVTRQVEHCGEPLETSDNGRLQVWWPPQTPHQYIIGVDPAGGGTEGDYACAQVIDRATGMQCAELHGHYPPRELAERVAQLGRHYNRALIAVERNNHGHAVLLYLCDVERYRNLYEVDGQLGWLTSAATRPGLVENFAAVVATGPQLIHSLRLLEECRTFVRHPDGTAAAAAGSHDDCVLAMAIALQVRKEAAGSLPRREMLELASLPTAE